MRRNHPKIKVIEDSECSEDQTETLVTEQVLIGLKRENQILQQLLAEGKSTKALELYMSKTTLGQTKAQMQNDLVQLEVQVSNRQLDLQRLRNHYRNSRREREVYGEQIEMVKEEIARCEGAYKQKETLETEQIQSLKSEVQELGLQAKRKQVSVAELQTQHRAIHNTSSQLQIEMLNADIDRNQQKYLHDTKLNKLVRQLQALDKQVIELQQVSRQQNLNHQLIRSTLCVICKLKRPVEGVLPCGHVRYCTECLDSVMTEGACRVCSVPISNRFKFYWG